CSGMSAAHDYNVETGWNWIRHTVYKLRESPGPVQSKSFALDNARSNDCLSSPYALYDQKSCV
ncbi:MAG TPA: hypothetical protein PKA91_09005, partial [Leptospiraceae bacterium]|nr:hypothetical protein [Leptospiraceae bacterium]